MFIHVLVVRTFGGGDGGQEAPQGSDLESFQQHVGCVSLTLRRDLFAGAYESRP